MVTVQPKGRGELGRAVTEVDVSPGLRPPRTHQVEPSHWCDRSEKHGGGSSFLAAHDIGAPVHPVGEVHVEVAGPAKHHFSARRRPSVGMRSGIISSHIGLNLDDAALHAWGNEDRVKQLGSDFGARPSEKRSG